MRAHHKHWVPEPVGSQPPNLFDALGDWVPRAVDTNTMPPAQPVDTSLEAAARVQGHTARLRMAILLYIRAQGGATDGEIAEGLGMNPSTVRPRRRELEGNAPWAEGKLPRLIERKGRRGGMRINFALAK